MESCSFPETQLVVNKISRTHHYFRLTLPKRSIPTVWTQEGVVRWKYEWTLAVDSGQCCSTCIEGNLNKCRRGKLWLISTAFVSGIHFLLNNNYLFLALCAKRSIMNGHVYMSIDRCCENGISFIYLFIIFIASLSLTESQRRTNYLFRSVVQFSWQVRKPYMQKSISYFDKLCFITLLCLPSKIIMV